jgi:hypothetical protein
MAILEKIIISIGSKKFDSSMMSYPLSFSEKKLSGCLTATRPPPLGFGKSIIAKTSRIQFVPLLENLESFARTLIFPTFPTPLISKFRSTIPFMSSELYTNSC